MHFTTRHRKACAVSFRALKQQVIERAFLPQFTFGKNDLVVAPARGFLRKAGSPQVLLTLIQQISHGIMTRS